MKKIFALLSVSLILVLTSCGSSTNSATEQEKQSEAPAAADSTAVDSTAAQATPAQEEKK